MGSSWKYSSSIVENLSNPMVKKKILPCSVDKQANGRQGFTLIEILIVVGVFSILALTASMTFFNLLKSSTKSRTTILVKQNGDYAMGVMTRMIRNARKLESCVSSSDHITIRNPDGYPTTFSCIDHPISSQSASLIDDTLAVSNCSFNCQDGGRFKPDAVTIRFTLSRIGSRPEEEASVNFETMVNLRNIDD